MVSDRLLISHGNIGRLGDLPGSSTITAVPFIRRPLESWSSSRRLRPDIRSFSLLNCILHQTSRSMVLGGRSHGGNLRLDPLPLAAILESEGISMKTSPGRLSQTLKDFRQSRWLSVFVLPCDPLQNESTSLFTGSHRYRCLDGY